MVVKKELHEYVMLSLELSGWGGCGFDCGVACDCISRMMLW
jgi:hypothetical protein